MEHTIRLSTIVEFYTLELLSALSNQTPRGMNSEVARSLASKKFESDLARYRARLEKNLGRAIRDYLIIASAREARHAFTCANEHISQFGQWRSITRYKPSAVIMALRTQFNDVEWTHGGYGGTSWGGIVDCAATYYELDNLTAFIDHVLDVEHNGGRLFDKTTAAQYVGLNMDWSKTDIHAFLTWKFESPDLLLDPRLYDMYGYCLSGKTVEFITRYANIYLPREERAPIECGIKVQRARHGKPSDNGAMYYEPLHWDDTECHFYLEESENGSVCESCGDHVYDGDEYPTESGWTYCESCYSDKIAYCEGGHEVEADDAIYLDEGTYCEDCATNDHTLCDECDEWKSKGDSFVYDGMDLCDECIDVHAPECAHCEVLVLEEERAELNPVTCIECESKFVGSPFEFQYFTKYDGIGMYTYGLDRQRYYQDTLELDWTNPRTPAVIIVAGNTKLGTNKTRLDKLGLYKTVEVRFSEKTAWGAVATPQGEPRAVGTMWDGRQCFYNPANSTPPSNGWSGNYAWDSGCVYPIVCVSDNERTV